jgi:hypothetical protein
MEKLIETNKERYPMKSYDDSEPFIDLEMGPDGWPILFAIPEEEKGNCLISSREFRWAYQDGNRIWLVHSDGGMVLYEDITQCWIDQKDEVFSLFGRNVAPQQVL